MALQYRFFTIPIKAVHEAESELNHFLRTVRVITIHREFVTQGENSFWGMAVEYMENGNPQTASSGIPGTGRKNIDYREVLSPEDFAIFVKLREWRKVTAVQEAVPVYTLFTNEQIAKMAEARITQISELQKVSGIGDARVKKYGEAVTRIVAEENNKNKKGTERK